MNEMLREFALNFTSLLANPSYFQIVSIAF